MAGFALTFALTVSNDLLFVVRRWVSLQQAMVAVSTAGAIDVRSDADRNVAYTTTG